MKYKQIIKKLNYRSRNKLWFALIASANEIQPGNLKSSYSFLDALEDYPFNNIVSFSLQDRSIDRA